MRMSLGGMPGKDCLDCLPGLPAWTRALSVLLLSSYAAIPQQTACNRLRLFQKKEADMLSCACAAPWRACCGGWVPDWAPDWAASLQGLAARE
jgi:hypothetical protein